MCSYTGNMVGMYNFVHKHQYDVREIFNKFLGVNINDVKLELRRKDLAIRIVVETNKIKPTIDTRVIFDVDRLDDYSILDDYNEILYDLFTLIKVKDRDLKLIKIIKKIKKSTQ